MRFGSWYIASADLAGTSWFTRSRGNAELTIGRLVLALHSPGQCRTASLCQPVRDALREELTDRDSLRTPERR